MKYIRKRAEHLCDPERVGGEGRGGDRGEVYKVA